MKTFVSKEGSSDQLSYYVTLSAEDVNYTDENSNRNEDYSVSYCSAKIEGTSETGGHSTYTEVENKLENNLLKSGFYWNENNGIFYAIGSSNKMSEAQAFNHISNILNASGWTIEKISEFPDNMESIWKI